MTTIAFKNGILAGDRRVTSGNLVEGQTTKVWKAHGKLFGVAGDPQIIGILSKWSQGGQQNDLPDLPDNTSWEWICVNRNRLFLSCVEQPGGLVMDLAAFAIGSGSAHARAAMHLGKSAKEAVRVASVFDMATGPEIDTVRL